MSEGPKLSPAQLLAIAREEVTSLIESLPEPLRDRAAAVPVIYERTPSRRLIEDGIEPDTLGLFVGPSFAEEGQAGSELPAQVLLFLDNLWDFAEEDQEIYRDEVRTTLMHELGHYLGLDEDDLFDRGLD